MEIRDFARQVLMAEKIEDKLFVPSSFTDKMPLFSGKLPVEPIRSRDFKEKTEKLSVKFPKAKELEKPEAVASAMHFFANHELLAMELMALCLLKFPDAPKAFRKGLVNEIIEEGRHLKLYKARLEKEGMKFGEIPSNDYFWRMLKDMEHPVEFCSKMSLSFEQANLDFSAYFRNEFKKIGDGETVDLLTEVYEDEIKHVSFGLHWFNKWNTESGDLFTRHKNSLKFPMGLQRAKAPGKLFDKDARRRAGFDDAYIRQLEMHSASRERPPVLRYFNPEVEAEISMGNKAFTPDKRMRSLKSSLEQLPAAFSLSQDIVLVESQPSDFFKEQLLRAGLPLPEFVCLDQWKEIKKERKIQDFRPWGNSISVASLLPESDKDIFLSELGKQSGLHSQVKSFQLLEEFVQKFSSAYPALIPSSDLGVIIKNPKEIDSWEQFPAVLKMNYALSGRGVRFVNDSGELLKVIPKSKESGKECVLEKEFSRLMDFSLQLDYVAESNTYKASYARFFSSKTGGYLGGVVGKNFFCGVSEEVKKFWYENSVDKLLCDLAEFLEPVLREVNFKSALGVDCFLYKNSDGKIYLKPLVEINLRYNMGTLKSKLSKQIRPGLSFYYHVIRRENFPALQPKYVQSIYKDFPELKIQRSDRGLEKGLVFLSDPLKESEFLALMISSASFEESRKSLNHYFSKEKK